MATEKQIMETLSQINDPEIGINIVDLGLIYNLILDEKSIKVIMTLTTPGCPMHTSISLGVQNAIRRLDNSRNVDVELVWYPRWTPDMMSDKAKKQLEYQM